MTTLHNLHEIASPTSTPPISASPISVSQNSISISIATRMRNIKPSTTLALAAKAKELQAQGKDVIDLAAGEPDFPPPQHAKDAAIAAINNNFSKYTAVDGIPSLKQAICDKFARENNLRYEPKQVLVSVGAKHSLYNACQALLDKGDEVIIPAPYWVSYPDMVLLAGGKPVILETDATQGFKITPQQLIDAVTPRSKIIIINSPSNPTGAVYTAAELAALAEVLLQYPNLVIISDDIYEHIFWGETSFSNILNVCPDLYARTLVVNGVSKAYAMPGWRIGYAAAGREDIIAAMKNVQAQSTSNPASIAQVAAEAALHGGTDCIKEMAAEFKRRHDFMIPELNKIPGFHALAAGGAFYAFPNVAAALARCGCASDVDFATLLLKEAEVAVVPGSAFGAPNHLRFSCTAAIPTLREALRRVAGVMVRL